MDALPRGRRHIKLYLGPMFSGKTKSMLNDLEVKRHAKSCEIVLLKYLKDTRSDSGIVLSASGASMRADAGILTGQEACEIIDEKIRTRKAWISTMVVGIDEGQFITDLYIFLEHILTYPGGISILLYVAALDSNFKREMWSEIVKAIPLVHQIKKSSSICQGECQDTPGQLTKRIVESEELELIGSNHYIATCLNCHLIVHNANTVVKRQTVEQVIMGQRPF
jgi:thymidine kinase